MPNPDQAPAATRSARQLVLCCDGTGNTLTAQRRDTNVLQLYQHLVAHPPADPLAERLLYYDPGVGTPDGAPATDLVDGLKRGWQRLAGLASGGGIYDNIGQAYLFLMRHWQGPQDRIFLFGFSRGAFTVRAVAGMVHLFGILRPEHEALLPTLLNIYFSSRDEDIGGLRKTLRRVCKGANHSPQGRQALAAQVRDMATSPAGGQAWVHWVGVWDTVETVGLPLLASRSLSSAATMHDKRVRHVRHALALDEHRWTFEPRLYVDPNGLPPADDPDGRTLDQRWFSGAHSDVGGGYLAREAGLSNEALHWLLAEAAPELGLNPAQLPPPAATTVTRERHDAVFSTRWWALAGMVLRNTRPRDVKGQPLEVVAAPSPPGVAPPGNPWRARRCPWPVLAALLLGGLCLLLQGYNLLDPAPSLLNPGHWPALAHAASDLASDQLAALWGQGLLAAGQAPWQRAGHAAWAWFWDLPFIACWGYLLARVSSRGFAWLAGTRAPGMALPRWRWLGMVPLLAVGADVVEDLLCLLAVALHALAAGQVACVVLWLAACAAAAKWLALLACGAWLALRWWLVFQPLGNAPPLQRLVRHLYALLLHGVLLWLLWLAMRATVCWGSYGWFGTLLCHTHYGIGLVLVSGGWLLWQLLRELAGGASEPLRWPALRAAWHQLEPRTARHTAAASALMLLFALLWLGMLLLSPYRF